MKTHHSIPGHVVTITGTASLVTARTRMTAHGIRHLPVVNDQNQLIGMITDRDIRSATPFSGKNGTGTEDKLWEFSKLKVADAMSRTPYSITPGATLQDVLALFNQTRVGAVPIVDGDRRVVGIVSATDLIEGFLEIIGANSPGVFVGAQCPDAPDALKRAVDVLTQAAFTIGSVLSLDNWLKGRRVMFFYLLTQSVARARRLLEENGFQRVDPMAWFLTRFQQTDAKHPETGTA